MKYLIIELDILETCYVFMQPIMRDLGLQFSFLKNFF